VKPILEQEESLRCEAIKLRHQVPCGALFGVLLAETRGGEVMAAEV